jgi:hypothetical protein
MRTSKAAEENNEQNEKQKVKTRMRTSKAAEENNKQNKKQRV